MEAACALTTQRAIFRVRSGVEITHAFSTRHIAIDAATRKNLESMPVLQAQLLEMLNRIPRLDVEIDICRSCFTRANPERGCTFASAWGTVSPRC